MTASHLALPSIVASLRKVGLFLTSRQGFAEPALEDAR